MEGSPGLKEYTLHEVSEHNSAKSLWLILNNQVYDVTTFHKRHPGGAAVMFQFAGKDATAPAFAAHSKSRQKKPEQIMKQFHIGSIIGPTKDVLGLNQGPSGKAADVVPAPDNQPRPAKSIHGPDGSGLGDGANVTINSLPSKFLDKFASETIVTDDFEEALYGEEAMVATADLLYQRLRLDKRLVRFMNGNNNLRQLAMRLRYFLAGAFNDPVWPPMRVNDNEIKGCVGNLADLLSDALKCPLPLGEDPLAAALHNLTTEQEWLDDPRSEAFFKHIQSMQRQEVTAPAADDVLPVLSTPSRKESVTSEASIPVSRKSSTTESVISEASQKSTPQEPSSKALTPRQEASKALTPRQDSKGSPRAPVSSKSSKALTPRQDSKVSPKSDASPKIAEPEPTPPPRPVELEVIHRPKNRLPSAGKAKGDSLGKPFDAVPEAVPVPVQAPAPTVDSEEEEEPDQYGGGIVDTLHFDELRLSPELTAHIRESWNMFLARVESEEAAGEAIFAAIFESAPSLQNLFKTPKAVQAMKFIISLLGFIRALDDPAALKTHVETLGFSHLHLEVTLPRVTIFKEAIIDLFMVELGPRLTPEAKEGWSTLLNYIGGGIIYIKVNYAERIETLMSSWKLVTGKKDTSQDELETKSLGSGESLGSGQSPASKDGNRSMQMKGNHAKKGKFASWMGAKGNNGSAGGNGEETNIKGLSNGNNSQLNIPTTFHEMFLFNAAVMGFGNENWMQEVLQCFDAIVISVNNTSRLQEECQMLALRMSKFASRGRLRLMDYKACMLASLRSLLPKDWTSAHEVAWTWLWENIERLLEANMYETPKFAKHLAKEMSGLDAKDRYAFRKDIFTTFFVAAPAGQDYFKQSNTRLHFVAEKVLSMTVEIYEDPIKLSSDIASLGLRHVGYGIPVNLFGPFVSAAVEVQKSYTKDEVAMQAFRWSLGLICKTLVRTIEEGSTIVMNAVNENSEKMLQKAVSCAPRGERNMWMLQVRAGAQTISPLIWAIESGRLLAATAIIQDLLTVRSDRERYYYGMEDIFRYHPDIVERFCSDAPSLLPPLLEGLVWRSRITKDGLRRVNTYLKYFIIDHEGLFSPALKAIVSAQDPKLMSDPLIVLVNDSLWNGLVKRLFLKRKMWFLVGLICFMVSQAILPGIVVQSSWQHGRDITLFSLRVINYCSTMRASLIKHVMSTWKDYRQKNTIKVGIFSVPSYLKDGYQQANLLLTVLFLTLLVHEPMLWCSPGGDVTRWPVEVCRASRDVEGQYKVISMMAMIVYFGLSVDMSVLSTGLSAFALVCTYVLGEVVQFLIGLIFLLLMFASAISALRHYHLQFRDVPNTALTLFAITVLRYEGDYREINDEPVLLGMVFLFVLASGVLLLNLLIAQLNCSYEFVYQDMVGFARLNRASCIVESMIGCDKSRWKRFVATLELDKKMDFNEGDVGMAGGLQTYEPSSLHPTAEDAILRFGGTCSPAEKWPEDNKQENLDRFERLEKLMHKAMKRMVQSVASSAQAGNVHGSLQEDSQVSRNDSTADDQGSSGNC